MSSPLGDGEESLPELVADYLNLIDEFIEQEITDEVIAERLNELLRDHVKGALHGVQQRPRRQIFRCHNRRR